MIRMIRMLMRSGEGRALIALVVLIAILAAALLAMIEAATHEKEDEFDVCD